MNMVVQVVGASWTPRARKMTTTIIVWTKTRLGRIIWGRRYPPGRPTPCLLMLLLPIHPFSRSPTNLYTNNRPFDRQCSRRSSKEYHHRHLHLVRLPP